MSDTNQPTHNDLVRENAELRQQLLEAEELINAVRTGAVDALAIQGPEGPRIFTLEGADERYRALIEHMSEGAVLLGPDATILYCNACLASWLGKGLEGVIGSSFDEFVPPEFGSSWRALLEQGWAGKGKGELPLKGPDGALRPLSLSMNVLPLHDLPVLAVIATDLSAEQEIRDIQALVDEQNVVIHRKNQELRQKEVARLAVEQAAAEARRLLEGIPQIAWTATPRGETTYLNGRWFEYTGQTDALPLAQQMDACLHPDDATLRAERWAQCQANGEVFEIEYRFRSAGGHYRWMLSRGLPSCDEDGNIMQWIGTCTDIHEHKLALGRIDQAQRELQENNTQLSRANVDLDNFVYTASHDLKAPISNIEGLLYALQGELPASIGESNQVLPILDMMQGSVDRFKRTIEHLTAVTKLQKENALPAARINLAQLIQEVSLDLAPLLQEAKAQLDIDVASCPTLSFAEKNLRSVVYNLLSNALKYRHPARPARIRISSRAIDNVATLTVQDNGLGLDVTNTDKLFAMFERLHDHVEGSGIGLYMVKRIVENAGGRIEVASQLGEGSTFTVYLATATR